MRTTLAARIAAVAAGVWSMFAPWILEYGGLAADNDRIVGPIAGSFAFVACWPVMMPLRWATLPCGVALLGAPVILRYDDPGAWASSIASGLVISTTAFVGTDVRSRFGGGWRSVRPSAWTAP